MVPWDMVACAVRESSRAYNPVFHLTDDCSCLDAVENAAYFQTCLPRVTSVTSRHINWGEMLPTTLVAVIGASGVMAPSRRALGQDRRHYLRTCIPRCH